MCERRDTVQVRSVDGEDSLSLRFLLKGREYHLLRTKQEPVGKALKRIETTVSKNDKEKKKQKKKKSGGASNDSPDFVSVEVHIYTSVSEEICPETSNRDAWVSCNTFVVDGTSFAISLNTPAIKYLRLPGCIMAECAAVPLVELEFADPEQCRWVWRKCDPGVLPSVASVFPETSSNVGASAIPGSQCLSTSSRETISTHPVISTSFVYWATEEDCGQSLILECLPCNQEGDEGQVVIVASENVVLNVQNVPMTERHLFTPTHLADPDQFRVVSYNILANVYASSEHSRQTLYPYCEARALDQEYRQCLIAREILGYRADVISLQEVGAKCFSQFLSPVFHHWGYEGCFHTKAGKTPEGEAIFFNRSKFSLVSEEAVVLREFVQQSPSCTSLLSLHPLILDCLLTRHNILQTAFLQSTERPDHYVLVANTHLYFHPMGDHIRLLQVEISLKYLENKLKVLKQTLAKDAHIAVIFCGDFNSCPYTAAYQYMLSGSVSRSHPDWQVYRMTQVPQCSCNHRALNIIQEHSELQWMGAQLSAGASEGPSVGVDLSHGLHFSNSCGTRYATNVTLGWTGVIDYIFVDSDHLRTQRVIPMPPVEQLMQHVALPSVNFPSDHIALVTDLIWRTD